MSTDVQVAGIKQESQEGEEGKEGQISPPMSAMIPMSSAAGVPIPFINGIPVMANPGGGNPVLVVPQPFPQFMQFYRPQFRDSSQ